MSCGHTTTTTMRLLKLRATLRTYYHVANKRGPNTKHANETLPKSPGSGSARNGGGGGARSTVSRRSAASSRKVPILEEHFRTESEKNQRWGSLASSFLGKHSHGVLNNVSKPHIAVGSGLEVHEKLAAAFARPHKKGVD